MGQQDGIRWSALAAAALLASACASTVNATESAAEAGVEAGPPPVVDLASAGANTCALRSDGRVRCWGRYGAADPDAPPAGTIAEVADLADAVRIAVQPEAPAGGCAVRAGGAVACWFTNAPTATGRPRAVERPLAARARDVVMGGAHACALTVDGAVLCWGDNRAGQLGDGSFGARDGAVTVAGLPAVEEVSAWESNTCARARDGAVYCWGRNFGGALGDGVSPHACPDAPGDDCSAVPVRVALPGAASRVSVGLNSGCALIGGAPYCWGWSLARRLPDGGGPPSAATRVGALADVSDVHAGYLSGAAIVRGEVYAWGVDYTTTGDGRDLPDATPRPVAGITRARRVVGGWYHQCALRDDGAVYCWGDGGFGQLGRPSPGRSGPVRVEGL